jgi:predicted signal transduction protein with EAL and GGDEF domain
VLKEVANPEVGVSVGVACFEDDSLAPEAMIDHADAAMYCAKGQGLNRIYVTRLGPSVPRAAVQAQPAWTEETASRRDAAKPGSE